MKTCKTCNGSKELNFETFSMPCPDCADSKEMTIEECVDRFFEPKGTFFVMLFLWIVIACMVGFVFWALFRLM